MALVYDTAIIPSEFTTFVQIALQHHWYSYKSFSLLRNLCQGVEESRFVDHANPHFMQVGIYIAMTSSFDGHASPNTLHTIEGT